MKKLLLLLPAIALLGACTNEGEKLPEPSAESKSVKLTAANSSLTNDALTEAKQVSLDIANKEEKYTVEFSPKSSLHGKIDYEFVLKEDAYLKSVSTYKVDRLVVDYMSKNGISFVVKNANDETVNSHESSVSTEYSGENDFGAVAEYPINGNSWSLVNTNSGKAGTCLYSVTVIFEI